MPNTTIWSSEPIQLSDEVSVDVSASLAGVVLGESANRVLASDLQLTPEKAVALANALRQGAAKCLEARAKS